MKKTFLTLGVAACMFVAAFESSALNYTITQTPGVVLNPGQSYTNTFDLVNDTSYNPVIEQIVGASAFFVVNDANAVLVDPILTPDVSISLDGGFFTGATGVIFLYTGGLVNLTLLADNLLEYVITALPSSQDQLEVSRAQLNFNTAPRSQGVPDGGATLILLGSSLLGMGFIGRRHLAMKA